MTVPNLPLLENHLWQSTLCVLAVWLLALLCKQSRAGVRYWLWFAASVKFLVPFSFLVSIGSRFGWRTLPAVTHPEWSVLIAGVGHPFAAVRATVELRASPPHSLEVLGIVLFGIWLCGFTVVTTLWIRSWHKMRSIKRAATPLALNVPIPAMSTRSPVEPGVFGIFRPVLLLPQGITDQLTPAQLGAIAAHEMCHVRRRDNLTAAIHAAIQAIFWFHPLLWWIRTRLLKERERACDEEVLRIGAEPGVYAEGILRVCRFYLEAPTGCASGIAGADLKRRIVRIMTECLGDRLNLRRKLLLGAVAVAAVAGPLAFGFVNAPRARSEHMQTAASPSFEVTSIKRNRSGDRRFSVGLHPGRFTTKNATTKSIIEFAYNLRSDTQLTGGPGWVNSDRYDIEAKIEDPLFTKISKLPPEQMEEQVRFMVQSLLANRFGLRVSHSTREVLGYALVMAPNGPKLVEATGPDSKGFQGTMMQPGKITFTDAPTALLADVLSNEPDLGGRFVFDETGLKGKYNFALQWTADGPASSPKEAGGDLPIMNAAAPPDTSGPSIFTAIKEQLGLKLESRKGPIDVLIIDRIETPTEN